MSAITMQELELETAELLPARETLWYGSSHSSNTAVVGSGDGNTEQVGLVNISALNGNGDGDFNTIYQVAESL
jgi:hypothetical protein